MKFYRERAMPSSDVFIYLGAIFLRIGQFQEHIVKHRFEIKAYNDYHGVKQGSWTGYAWTIKENSRMIEVKKEDVKKWNIYLHKEMYKEVIALIFMHNPTPQEGK